MKSISKPWSVSQLGENPFTPEDCLLSETENEKLKLNINSNIVLEKEETLNIPNLSSQFEYIEIARGEARDGGAAVVHIYELEKEEE